MIVNPAEYLKCTSSAPCSDMMPGPVICPNVKVDTDKIKVVMISEVPPEKPDDYFYAGPDSFYFQTISQAFQDAGVAVKSMDDLINMGIYITTAVKCPKTDYAVSTDTVKKCAVLLEKEIKLFPNVQVYMLMGDVAIKAMNFIARKNTGKGIIPSGASTYKIRYGEYYYDNKRVFPSYVITGKSFFIEKSKRVMIADDIGRMLKVLK